MVVPVAEEFLIVYLANELLHPITTGEIRDGEAKFEVGAVYPRNPMLFTHRMKNSMLLGKHSGHCRLSN